MTAVAQYDLDGNLIAIYNSVKDAATCNNITHPGIVRCCRFTQHSAGGFQWRYYNEHHTESINKISPKKTKVVLQYSKTGEYITSFKNATEAEKVTKVDKSSIGRCCRNELKTAGGYVWKFKTNEKELLQ